MVVQECLIPTRTTITALGIEGSNLIAKYENSRCRWLSTGYLINCKAEIAADSQIKPRIDSHRVEKLAVKCCRSVQIWLLVIWSSWLCYVTQLVCWSRSFNYSCRKHFLGGGWVKKCVGALGNTWVRPTMCDWRERSSNAKTSVPSLASFLDWPVSLQVGFRLGQSAVINL